MGTAIQVNWDFSVIPQQEKSKARQRAYDTFSTTQVASKNNARLVS